MSHVHHETHRTERYATDRGYAVGTVDEAGEWLTVRGADDETIPLFAGPADAKAWHAGRSIATEQDATVRLVERDGPAGFRIVERT